MLGFSAKQTTAAAVIAACQMTAYLTLWSVGWAMWEAVPRQAEPPALMVLGDLLGFPIMFLPVRWIVGFGRLVGRPYVVVLAGVNGLLWGVAAVWVWQKLGGRQAQASG